MHNHAKIIFNEMTLEHSDLLIIAREYSDDENATMLVKKLKIEHSRYNICVIDSDNLERMCINFLFNLVKFSVIGIADVLLNIHFLEIFKNDLRLKRAISSKSRLLCGFQGLNLRFAKELFLQGISCKSSENVKLYYYISPQIWS
jgi:lipid A disaccharide synthetase